MPRDLLGMDRAGMPVPTPDSPDGGARRGMVSRGVSPGDPQPRESAELSVGTGSFGDTIAVGQGWGHVAAPYAWLGAMCILLALLEGVSRAFWIPRGVIFAVAGVALCFGGAWLIRVLLRRARENRPVPGLRFLVDPDARVRVVAPAALARSLLEDCEKMKVEPFEVEVVRAWFASRMTRVQVWCFVAITLASLGGFVLLGMLAQTRWLPQFNSFQFFGAFATAAFLTDACWPTYLRVSPGRLERLRYGFLGRGKPDVEVMDLRGERVWVNFRGRFVLVFPMEIDPVQASKEAWRRDGTPRSRGTPRPEALGGKGVTFWAWWRSEEFLRLVVHGALTSAARPPLPEDELVG